MSVLLAIKTWAAKQAVRLGLKAGKAFLNSLMGKNKGEIDRFRKDDSRNVICFIHGFNGKPGQTFGEFPKLIISDPKLDGWDVFSVGFATDMMPTMRLGLWAELPDIDKLSKFLITNIKALFSQYDRIAIVAHSMGGLVAQKAILDIEPAHRDRITSLFLYGTPSNGLRKAAFARWINPQLNDMAIDGPFIKNLREDWKNRFPVSMPFTFVTVAGELDAFVPVESSQQPFSSGHAITIGNHIDMVKPDSVDHTSYAILKNTIISGKPFLQTFKNQELNNILGDYARIISSLRNQLDKIGRKDFIEYIFALEGYQDVEQAIQALEKSNRVQNDTDFMGILGGRYKRKYLAGKLEADKNKAIELYKSGYELSKSKNDHMQVFFHAINLAFLYLYGDNNRYLMKQFATDALNSANLSNNDDKWEVATKAEASLYLNDFDDARIQYTSAIQKAGTDERAISSMYLNAYNACIALDKNDWAIEIDRLFKRN